MADQGAIGREGSASSFLVATRRFPTYAVTEIANALTENGTITGSVSESGVGTVANVCVLLYWRPSGQLIARTWTDASGNFIFTNLDPSKSYTVVAQDPATGTQYNDLVYALVQPA